jgi:hypothetical protein
VRYLTRPRPLFVSLFLVSRRRSCSHVPTQNKSRVSGSGSGPLQHCVLDSTVVDSVTDDQGEVIIIS